MRKVVLLFLVCAFACTQAYAQKPRLSREEFKKKKQEYIIQQAGLTESEAARFFPLYQEMRGKMHKMNESVGKAEKELRDGKKTEQKYVEVMERIYDNRIESDKLEKQYYAKFRSFLSGEKLYKIYKAEIDFHRRILKKMVH